MNDFGLTRDEVKKYLKKLTPPKVMAVAPGFREERNKYNYQYREVFSIDLENSTYLEISPGEDYYFDKKPDPFHPGTELWVCKPLNRHNAPENGADINR